MPSSKTIFYRRYLRIREKSFADVDLSSRAYLPAFLAWNLANFCDYTK